MKNSKIAIPDTIDHPILDGFDSVKTKANNKAVKNTLRVVPV
jgi:hypothetical protein